MTLVASLVGLLLAQASLRVEAQVRWATHPRPPQGMLEIVTPPTTPEAPLQVQFDASGRFWLTLPAFDPERPPVVSAVLRTRSGRVPAEVLWHRAADSAPRLEVTLREGWFLLAQVTPPPGAATLPARVKVAVATGWVDPADLSEAEVEAAEGGQHVATRAELIQFRDLRILSTSPDGRIGPVWVDAAEAYQLIAATELHWTARRFDPPLELPPGETWDAGSVPLALATGVEVTLETGPVSLDGFALRTVRLPDNSEGDRLATELFALRPRLAEAVFGEARLELVAGQPLLLAPLPADGAVALVLEAPTGRVAAPRRVPLRPGEIVRITLDAVELFPPEDRTAARLQGRLVWSGSGDPIVGATVAVLPGETRTTTDAMGTFSLGGLPRHQTLTFLLTGLGDSYPERVVQRQLALSEDSTEVAWAVAPYRWLRARGLQGPDPGPTHPQGFVLERQLAAGGWTVASADVFEVVPDGVDVSLVEGGRYRVTALWTPLLVQRTAAIDVPDGSTEERADFAPIATAAPLTGVVVDAAGSALPGTAVVAVGPASGAPPIEVWTDAAGRFAFGPTNVDELTLLTQGPEGEVELTVRPALTPFVVVRVGEAE